MKIRDKPKLKDVLANISLCPLKKKKSQETQRKSKTLPD